jgi:hypothetical protein
MALAQLARVCTGIILLETVVLPGNYPEVQLITEPLIANQALSGFGWRPRPCCAYRDGHRRAVA